MSRRIGTLRPKLLTRSGGRGSVIGWTRVLERVPWHPRPAGTARTTRTARFVALVRGTFAGAWEHRAHGLAAEVGFWALLSFAPLLLGMLALVGYVAPALGPGVTAAMEQQVLDALAQFLTEATLNNLVQPLVHGTLSQGRAAVASLGFLVSFWTGSTALGACLNAIAIAYGQQGVRGMVYNRLLALALYAGALVFGVAFLPLLVIGPRTIARLLPDEIRSFTPTLINIAYWPAVAVLAFVVALVFYWVGMPGSVRFGQHFPGAVLAVAIWMVGSIALRSFLRFVFSNLAMYGPLAAPIAALLFFYVAALAVLLGAELNAQRISRRAPARQDRI
ncbi:MAG: YihY/virulence factor BrkB family protein [Streptosporangiales bacterium]|nr:YihY/virulence factor BrkB family protein [Streptosporangiales bacterium]